MTRPTSALLLPFATGLGMGMLLLSFIQRRRKESRPAPRRFGGAIKLRPEKYQRYRELHDNVWKAILDRMYQSNIRNFTIYYHKETNTLFQHFEWVGHWKNPQDDEAKIFGQDMDAIAADPVTREWWIECEPCQEPFSQWKSGFKPPSAGGAGEWWAPLECVTHCGHWPLAYSSQQRDPDFLPLSSRNLSK